MRKKTLTQKNLETSRKYFM